jgi:hypothetical protein
MNLQSVRIGVIHNDLHSAFPWALIKRPLDAYNVALGEVVALYSTGTQTTISQGFVLSKPWLVTVVCFDITVHVFDELLQQVHLL